MSQFVPPQSSRSSPSWQDTLPERPDTLTPQIHILQGTLLGYRKSSSPTPQSQSALEKVIQKTDELLCHELSYPPAFPLNAISVATPHHCEAFGTIAKELDEVFPAQHPLRKTSGVQSLLDNINQLLGRELEIDRVFKQRQEDFVVCNLPSSPPIISALLRGGCIGSRQTLIRELKIKDSELPRSLHSDTLDFEIFDVKEKFIRDDSTVRLILPWQRIVRDTLFYESKLKDGRVIHIQKNPAVPSLTIPLHPALLIIAERFKSRFAPLFSSQPIASQTPNVLYLNGSLPTAQLLIDARLQELVATGYFQKDRAPNVISVRPTILKPADFTGRLSPHLLTVSFDT